MSISAKARGSGAHVWTDTGNWKTHASIPEPYSTSLTTRCPRAQDRPTCELTDIRLFYLTVSSSVVHERVTFLPQP
jgi:hypothetical protein